MATLHRRRPFICLLPCCPPNDVKELYPNNTPHPPTNMPPSLQNATFIATVVRRRRSLWPRAGHFSVLAAMPRRVVGLEHARLRLVGLREGVAALLAHPLHLADLADRLLELLHAARRTRLAGGFLQHIGTGAAHTVVYSLECCTFESPGRGGTPRASTGAC